MFGKYIILQPWLVLGATAINPYLALETIGLFDKESGLKKEKLIDNFIYAVNAGLLKIFSKMGISTLQSYHGAQIFEILGINEQVVKMYFTGAVSRIGGLGLDEIAKETLIKHHRGFGSKTQSDSLLSTGGIYRWRKRGEGHLFNPETIHLLQKAAERNDYQTFKKYSNLINDQSGQAYAIRGLFEFNYNNRMPININEVEPAESIFKRFCYRSDVFWLHFARGTLYAGYRYEPHWRQEQYRRRRRRRDSLSGNEKWRFYAFSH